MTTKEKESTQVSTKEALKMHGYNNLVEVMKESTLGTRVGVPAVCEYGCIVEPDGRCQHGNDSVLRENYLI